MSCGVLVVEPNCIHWVLHEKRGGTWHAYAQRTVAFQICEEGPPTVHLLERALQQLSPEKVPCFCALSNRLALGQIISVPNGEDPTRSITKHMRQMLPAPDDITWTSSLLSTDQSSRFFWIGAIEHPLLTALSHALRRYVQLEAIIPISTAYWHLVTHFGGKHTAWAILDKGHGAFVNFPAHQVSLWENRPEEETIPAFIREKARLLEAPCVYCTQSTAEALRQEGDLPANNIVIAEGPTTCMVATGVIAACQAHPDLNFLSLGTGWRLNHWFLTTRWRPTLLVAASIPLFIGLALCSYSHQMRRHQATWGREVADLQALCTQIDGEKEALRQLQQKCTWVSSLRESQQAWVKLLNGIQKALETGGPAWIDRLKLVYEPQDTLEATTAEGRKPLSGCRLELAINLLDGERNSAQRVNSTLNALARTPPLRALESMQLDQQDKEHLRFLCALSLDAEHYF